MIASKYLNAGVFIVIPFVAILAYFSDEPFLITLTTKAVIFAIAGIGLNIALGYGGLISLGHAVFFGLGGYAMGILASHAQSNVPIYDGLFLIEGTKSMIIIWLVAMLVSGLFALLIGLLSLRTSGVYFIMVTLAFGEMFYYFSISWPAYGGEDGLLIYVRNNFSGLNTLDPIQFFSITFSLLAITLLFTYFLKNSFFGLVLNAIRQTPDRVETVGINLFKSRLIAFVISGMITGLAGALFADLNRFVSPTMFSWQTSGEIMVFIILGGVGRLFGPVVGACLFILLEYLLDGVSEFWHIYLGLILLFVVLIAKNGVIGSLSRRETSND